MMAHRTYWLVLAGLTLAAASLCQARRLKQAPPAGDRIAVVGHVALPGGAASQILEGVHWRRRFLYIEQPGRNTLVTVDITIPAKPAITSELTLPANSRVSAVEGQAVLTAAFPNPAPAVEAQGSVQVLDFSDPEHPKVAREFSQVSAMLRDTGRGLIYVVNGEGLWILEKQPAPDTELEEQFAHHVIYDH